MNCPKCGHSRTCVTSSPLPRRRRKCQSSLCGYTWTTIEISEDDGVGIDARVRKALRIVREACDDAEGHICTKRP